MSGAARGIGPEPWWVVGLPASAGAVLPASAALNAADRLVPCLVLTAIGLAVVLGSAVGTMVWRAQVQAAVAGVVTAASLDLVTGRVPALPVVARVMGSRAITGGPSFTADAPRPLSTPPILLRLVVPGPEGPRHAAALPPVVLPGTRWTEAVGVVLHPSAPVAVVDPRADPAWVASAPADPGWRTATAWSGLYAQGLRRTGVRAAAGFGAGLAVVGVVLLFFAVFPG